ncbi:hypothetical protein LZ31DRAFT_482671, partial [Colletotrichum somersetense]
RHTIDFGSDYAGGIQAKASNVFYLKFFLDFFSVVGKPGCIIIRRNGSIFNNITAAPYGVKHVSGIPFNITGRMFRVVQAAIRKVWFIMIHLVLGEIIELPLSAANSRRRKELAGKRSKIPANLAWPLASYITSVF